MRLIARNKPWSPLHRLGRRSLRWHQAMGRSDGSRTGVIGSFMD